MTDALQRLRAANPVPADPGAPPIEDVRARIATDQPVPANRPRWRWRVGAVAPVLGALAVAAVVAGVVLVIHVRSQPATSPAAPVGGMRGTVTPYASGLDGDIGWTWFTRCLGKCDGFSEHLSSWLATSTDGGTTWTVAQRRRLLIPPVSGSGQNLWASLTAEQGDGATVVTHDGGLHWQAVDVPRSPNPYSVSVAGGEAWAVGSGCSGICGDAILHGPASGSHLSPTAASPGARGELQIIAVSATSAYLYVMLGGGHPKAWVTTDGGRSWLSTAPGCASETVAGSGTGAIWRSCRPSDSHSAFGISTDAGRHWVYRRASFSTGILDPSSARIAWAQTYEGATMRTTNGGRSWQTVFGPLSPYDADHKSLSEDLAHKATLSVQSARTATETIPVTHTQDGVTRTNFVVYRTTDGGGQWQRAPVPLPSR